VLLITKDLDRHLSGAIHPPNYVWPRQAPATGHFFAGASERTASAADLTLPPGIYRIAITTATAVYAALTSVID
jgi:hypothetical protein